MATQSNDPQHALLRNLAHELFQTEVSASRHCRREARRNPGTPPAEALLAVASHADEALRELGELALMNDLPRSTLGKWLGSLFSERRERAADHLIDGERSYRGTLLGIRHGADLVRIFKAAAEHGHHDELKVWADRWLARREVLLKQVERQLDWFAVHVDRALARAH